MKKLSECCTKITDGAHHTPTYTDKGIPFLRVTDITTELNWNKVKYIPQKEHEDLIKRCKPEKGDVLYSKNGTIGVPKLVTWDKDFSIFVSLALLKVKKETLRSEFLESFLLTPRALEQARKHSKTGTVTNLHLIEIREMQIPVPSLIEQDMWISQRNFLENIKATLQQSLSDMNKLFASLQNQAFNDTL
ncbi:restriction endonuclease subunit S [Acinetobacter venetianus]|uniref:restriction endonuclease subunit S n=1 Tax=Acinetobacter venetianus TaxID=52133 RepID=UPI002ABECB77|nr:restriction endonuclease subunit S [Acinetobacter venetianus]